MCQSPGPCRNGRPGPGDVSLSEGLQVSLATVTQCRGLSSHYRALLPTIHPRRLLSQRQHRCYSQDWLQETVCWQHRHRSSLSPGGSAEACGKPTPYSKSAFPAASWFEPFYKASPLGRVISCSTSLTPQERGDARSLGTGQPCEQNLSGVTATTSLPSS